MAEKQLILRVGSRGSKLALDQTNQVLNEIKTKHPYITFEIKVIKTSGDEGKIEVLGAWVKEVEYALRTKEIDLAVHSYKDVPTALPEGLIIGAIPKRADHRDCLIARNDFTINNLPQGATVGTSSMRRAFQIKELRPDVNVIEIHGNIFTRMGFVENGKLDAIILAMAGLERVFLTDKATYIFENNELLCAVAQGALAIEIREEDESLKQILSGINHEDTAVAAETERAFLRALGGGCRMPIAAFAKVENGEIELVGKMFNEAGTQVVQGKINSKVSEASYIGEKLAKDLLKKF